MTLDAVDTDAHLVLTADSVSVVLDVTGGRLPAIIHWGAALPAMDAGQVAALVEAAMPVIGSNNPDVAPRVAVLPEHHTGWTGRPGLAGSRGGRHWSPAFSVTSVLVDGVQAHGYVTAGAASVEFRAVDPFGLLGLTLVVQLLDTGLLRVRAAVTNLAEEPYTVDGLTPALPVPADAEELLDFAGRHNQERVPQRTPLRTGVHLRENRKGRTGADSAYVLHAGPAGFGFATGRIHAVHTAFSGNHVHYAERVLTGECLLGGGEVLLPGEIRLGKDETYTSPWLYGAFGEGLDDIARRFHRHLRGRPRPVTPERPVTLNVWEAVYFAHDRDRLLDLADRAAEIGVERFVLDDGWFGARRHDRAGLGDWVVSAEVWPDGLYPLVDRVRKRGMQFGLWFEPEMVNADSDVARAHPEWIMSARPEWPVESRGQQVLNLGIPGAYAHVKSQILALLDEYDIGYIKWDHNRDLIEAGTQTDEGRPGVHAQTLAFYRLLDEIREAHADLEIESCSSGGSRIDLAVLERTDRVWVSDNIDPHDRQRMLRWTAQLLPPEYLGSHIASGRSHVTGRIHDLGFRAGTALFGHLGIEWDLALASERDMAELKAWIAFYKEHRRFLLTGDMVRMDGVGERIHLHGVVAPDRSRALFAFAPADSLYPDPAPRLRFRGLDPQRAYRVRPVFVGSVPSGLRPPTWWGRPEKGVPPPPADRPYELKIPSDAGYPGGVFLGAALERTGVAAPVVHPDQVVLLRIDADEGSSG